LNLRDHLHEKAQRQESAASLLEQAMALLAN
jgi:hypothetical protein